MLFDSYDHTRLSYRRVGGGPLLVCVPGGPLLSADYLDDLGRLTDHAELALLDHRGSGASATPTDPTSYRCDRIVDDLEAFREHLAVARLDLLGHSAGANVVHRYAERHPDRVGRLVLVTPSPRAVGVEITDAERDAVAASRSGEPWYAEAAAALARVQEGRATPADWAALDPFTHGRWDDEVAAFAAGMEQGRNEVGQQEFAAPGAFDPPVTRAALAALDVPVLVVAGGVDVGNPVAAMARIASLFPRGELVELDAAGHYPWRDDAAAFRDVVGSWLRRTS